MYTIKVKLILANLTVTALVCQAWKLLKHIFGLSQYIYSKNTVSFLLIQ